MFLESFGRFCCSSMRPSLFYFLLLVPFLVTGSYLWSRLSRERQLETQWIEAVRKGKTAIERKERKEKFLKRYCNADPFFLEKEIESLSFLQKERLTILSMIHHPALSDRQPLQKRLEFLESEKNRLSFLEENVRSSSKIRETDENQRHPVQMDENDLQQLLTWIEEIPFGENEPLSNMPQLLVRNLKMKKIETPLQSEVYEVEMQLLKREWKTL